MLAREIITEKYVHNVDFDMATFARNMAALRASKYMPDNYPDAILFLGFIGDPETKLSWISRPAKIANYDIPGIQAAKLPQHKQGPWPNTKPEDLPAGSYTTSVIDPEIAANPNELEFDIWVHSQYADMRNPRALASNQTRVIAHELRHRGFDIIDNIPALKTRMPEIYQSIGSWGIPVDPRYEPYITKKLNSKYMEPYGREGTLRPKHDFYLTHAMMYALEYPAIHGHYDDDKQLQAYKKLYMDCERVVRQYLDGKSVPPQGWAILRNEVDKRTPDNVQITIKPGPDHAVVTGTTKPAENPSNSPSAPSREKRRVRREPVSNIPSSPPSPSTTPTTTPSNTSSGYVKRTRKI